MPAGRRDVLVSLERATVVQDPYGEEQLTWGALGSEWCQLFYGRGDERRQAAMEQGQQAATFNMLANKRTRGLTLKDRLTADGVVWDIVGLAPDTPGRGQFEATAVRAA